MTEEVKLLSNEQLEAEVLERYKANKEALDKLNAAGLVRRASDIEPNNGLGSGWVKTLSNMTATGLVGLLLFLAQNEGFKILRGLMEESKEQRKSFADSMEALRRERETDRVSTQRHADEATNAMRDIAKGLRALNKQKDDNEFLNDELQGLTRPLPKAEVKPDTKSDVKTVKKING